MGAARKSKGEYISPPRPEGFDDTPHASLVSECMYTLILLSIFLDFINPYLTYIELYVIIIVGLDRCG